MYIRSIHDIIDKYDYFVVDIWGVIHNGRCLFPHVKETLQEIKNLGKQVVFLSNAPRRSRDVANDLEYFGLSREDYHDIHTSGEDAYEHIAAEKKAHYTHLSSKCYALITSAGHVEMMTDCGLERVGDLSEASFILNMQPENSKNMTSKDYETLLNDALKYDLPMICVNPDMSVILGESVHRCAGTIARYYEKIGGTVHYHGKPFQSVYDSVFQKFNVVEGVINKKRVLAIGDSLKTDVAGAISAGINSLLVLSGIEALNTRPSDIVTLEDFSQTLLKESLIKPTYVCSELR